MFHLHLLAERIMSNIYSLSPLYTIHIYIIQYRQSDNTPEYKYKSNIRLYLVEDMANAKRLLDGAPFLLVLVLFLRPCSVFTLHWELCRYSLRFCLFHYNSPIFYTRYRFNYVYTLNTSSPPCYFNETYSKSIW
jgi:hypothetical protein